MTSRSAKYALRILGYLAGQPSQWILGKDIASATGIPSNYLSKILSLLHKRGFVDRRRGWGGGFRLNKRGMETPTLEVLQLFDGVGFGSECLFGLPKCDASNPCPLHDHWQTIQECYLDMSTSLKVSDLQAKNKTGK
jgi:Rrf2 family protein